MNNVYAEFLHFQSQFHFVSVTFYDAFKFKFFMIT